MVGHILLIEIIPMNNELQEPVNRSPVPSCFSHEHLLLYCSNRLAYSYPASDGLNHFFLSFFACRFSLVVSFACFCCSRLPLSFFPPLSPISIPPLSSCIQTLWLNLVLPRSVSTVKVRDMPTHAHI